ncbi:MAG TPA: zinc-dependent metalloprotease, partial [Chitinophagaceae bacterium]|nr:zinc-dependent metalloprotease [Chitinophagaceae bacterium]
ANCGNDFVDDTPLHNTYNFGCPGEGHLSTCTGNPLEMWMNYMDYTDDRCMYFLSDGQVSRAGYFIDNDLQLQSIINSACVLGGNSPLTRSGNTEITPRGISQFLLYPSISKGRVNLEVNSAISGIGQMRIYNLAGVLVEQQRIVLSPGRNTKEIDLSHLVNGLYLVQFGNGLKDPVQKLVIQQ